MSEEERITTPEEKKHTLTRDVRHVSSTDFAGYLRNVTDDLDKFEKCLLLFDFSKTNAAEMSKFLVIINDLHRCTQNIRDTSEQLLCGDIVVDK